LLPTFAPVLPAASLAWLTSDRCPARARTPKAVEERLGHASSGVTLDIHSHVMPGMQDEAAEKIDAGLRLALAA